MQKPIMVTVIMFVYNHEKYLRKAIESVLNQDVDFAYEILIHDDASTDGSADIIREYAAQFPDRVLPILQDKNQVSQGVSLMENFLLPNVRGKYIAFCEGDDYWLSKRKLQIQVDFLEKHQNFTAVTHNCRFVNESDQPVPPVEKFYPFHKSCRYTLGELVLEERMPGQTATWLCRNEIYTRMTPEQRAAHNRIRYTVADRRRTLLFLLNGPVYCIARELSAYRYVISSGGSWNAYAHKRNLAGSYFVQELDFRRFAQDQFQISLKNDYALFGTGLMAFLRYLKNREKNRDQWQKVRKEFDSFFSYVLFMFRLFPGALYVCWKRKHTFLNYDDKERRHGQKKSIYRNVR